MSCCRAFLQRGSHMPLWRPSIMARGPLRLRPLTSPKSSLLRNMSTTAARLNQAPQDPRLAGQNLYPSPDKAKRYRKSQVVPCIQGFVWDRSNAATVFPERLVIYHAGTGRVAFLAILKLTTVVMSAIFCGVLVPAYITDEKPWRECLGRKSPTHASLPASTGPVI